MKRIFFFLLLTTSSFAYGQNKVVLSVSGVSPYTDANARAAISLTTAGTSGAATYSSATGVLNIPNYEGGTWNGLLLNTLQTSSTSVTLSTHGLYTYVGTADATFTLPDLSSNLNRVYFIKNSSAFNVTVQRAGSDNLFTTSSVTSITIPPGSSRILGATTASGTSYWHVMDLSEGSGGGATAINDIGDATAAGLVTVGNNSQQWDFTGLTGSGMLIQANTTAATSNLHKLHRVITTGANASSSVTSIAAEILNSHTGTSSTNIGLLAAATNGTNNHAIVVGSGNGNVGFGTSTPNANAILELTSTTQGLLPPRMTTAQRNAIASPTAGLQVYDTDFGNNFTYSGTSWFNEGVPNYNNQTGTTYTLLSSDAGKIVTFDNAADITLTVPTGLPVGFTCTIIQLGAGKVIFTASSTNVYNVDGFDRTKGQRAVAMITQYSTNNFITSGGMQ